MVSAPRSEQSETVSLQEAQLCRFQPAELAACEPLHVPAGGDAAAAEAEDRAGVFLDVIYALMERPGALCGLLRREDLGRLALACRGAFAMLAPWAGWARYHGFVLPAGLPPGYSAMKLSQCLLRREAAAAATQQGRLVDAGNWTSGGGVANQVTFGAANHLHAELCSFRMHGQRYRAAWNMIFNTV